MKNFTRYALAGAVALTFAASAGAQTTSGTTSGATNGTTGGATSGATTPSARNDNTMRGPSANANTPTQCAKLTGRQLGECIKEHGGASGNGASASNPTERGDWGKKNDRSTEGSSGTGNGMGTSGGANDTTAGGHVGASSQSTTKGAPK